MKLQNVIEIDQVVNEVKAIVEENPFFQYPLYQFCECERWEEAAQKMKMNATFTQTKAAATSTRTMSRCVSSATGFIATI